VHFTIKNISPNQHQIFHPLGETQKRSKARILLPQTAILSIQLPNLGLMMVLLFRIVGCVQPPIVSFAESSLKKKF
jgi:hypothetical protein